MSFRIGITIGDVVERDGDLLGDGVNIASRLGGIAQPGGLCVARTVYEQVANKLSVEFVDIGEQEVKNLPVPIHAYALALGAEDRRLQALAQKNKRRTSSIWPIAITAASLATVAVVGLFYVTGLRNAAPNGVTPVQVAANEPQAPPPPPVPRPPEALVPETVPFIADRQRLAIRTAYMPAPDHKAIAISFVQAAFTSGQKDEESAKAAALAACRQATEPIVSGMRCDLYAVGDTVVYARGRPPLPPEPWLAHDSSIEVPFAADSVPLVNDVVRGNLQKNYMHGRKSKALAISPQGLIGVSLGQASPEEAVRRALETCGARAGAACVIVGFDDAFVVPIPATMKVVGLFRAAGYAAVVPEARDDLARRLGNATSGWNAVAVGANGRPGLMLRAGSEKEATDGALVDCGRQDRACRVVAIGPFTVEPK